MKTDYKIINYKQANTVAAKIHKKGKKIVLATGCFDILHIGHLFFLNFCKSKGDVLLVSVGNDKTVRFLKGPGRPIIKEKNRARMIAGIQIIDYVVISEEFGKMDHNKLVEIIKPDIYIAPITDTAVKEKKELIKKVGGKFVIYNRNKLKKEIQTLSSTAVGEKLLKYFNNF